MLIDSHCHLETFLDRGDLSEVINEASRAGVNRLITIGTCSGDWEKYRTMANAHPGKIYHTLGLHPGKVDENWENEVAALESLLSMGGAVRPVALGEIGLDYFHLPKDRNQRAAVIELQKLAFQAQLELSKQHQLPIVVHSRSAFDDCVKLIDSSGANWEKTVFHCFSGGRDEIDRINLRGGRGSFTGIVTYGIPSVKPVCEAVVEQGLERLMIETDCPYLTPVPHRGKENRPAYLRHTFQFLASVLETPMQDLEKQISRNTLEFFGIQS